MKKMEFQNAINSIYLSEKFENGYIFENASLVNNALKDEEGKKIEKFKYCMPDPVPLAEPERHHLPLRGSRLGLCHKP